MSLCTGSQSREDIAAVVQLVDRPVNVVMGLQGVQLSLADLSAIGSEARQRGSASLAPLLEPFFALRGDARERYLGFAEDAVSFRISTPCLDMTQTLSMKKIGIVGASLGYPPWITTQNLSSQRAVGRDRRLQVASTPEMSIGVVGPEQGRVLPSALMAMRILVAI